MRDRIKAEILKIEPLDTLEANQIARALAWIDSGADLFRVTKPGIPNPHLVSYFVVIDGDHILLVDHINAELWLPNGGHVDQNEHPKDTATREAKEELSIQAEFITQDPLFLTITETVAKTAGHTDISLWYAVKGDRHQAYSVDQSEFTSLRWFHRADAPFHRSDPNLSRFLNKFYGLGAS